MNVRRPLLWAIAFVFAIVVGVGIAISRGWLREPSLTRSDYVGTIEVSADDARLYRAVPFEWRVTGPTGRVGGRDVAHIRIDPTGERTVICGWLTLDKGGASTRASRWLSEATLRIGDLAIPALFIAAVQAAPGNGLNAGCAGLFDRLEPAVDAPLSLDGPAVPE
ncbi:MAG: hypothetical protein OJF58_000582 [Enhydrobacter sp.]|nr:MAG: hypothetical protein OJF58_000582 [Enhydrobacter sp.]